MSPVPRTLCSKYFVFGRCVLSVESKTLGGCSTIGRAPLWGFVGDYNSLTEAMDLAHGKVAKK